MGITKYFRFLSDQYPACTKSVQLPSSRVGKGVELDRGFGNGPERYEHMFVDVNNLLYGPVSFANDERHFFLRLARCLDSLYSFAHPSKSMFLAVDGPGPKAKLITQRARRQQKTAQNDERESRGPRKSKRTREKIDSVQFTPGTGFMASLNAALDDYGSRRAFFHQPASEPLKVYVSGASDVGEGELKIFEMMKTMVGMPEEAGVGGRKEGGKPAAEAGQEKRQERQKPRCLVVGNDSDLVAYSLKLSHAFDIDVLKFSAFGNSGHELVSVAQLRKDLLKRVFGTQRDDVTFEMEQAAIDDFVLLSLFSGNDYMPRVYGFALHKGWKAYCKTRQRQEFRHVSLWNATGAGQEPQKATLDGPLLEAMLHTMRADVDPKYAHAFESSAGFEMTADAGGGGSEKMNLRNEVATLVRRAQLGTLEVSEPVAVPSGGFLGQVLLDGKVVGSGLGKSKKRATYASLEEALPYVQERYDMAGVSAPVPMLLEERRVPQTVEEKIDQLELYSRGLAWIMEYFSGRCTDYSFLYPYTNGPHLATLAAWPKTTTGMDLPISDELPLTPIEFSLALLPKRVAQKYVEKPFGDVLNNEEVTKRLEKTTWRTDADDIISGLKEDVNAFVQQQESSTRLAKMNKFSPPHMFTRIKRTEGHSDHVFRAPAIFNANFSSPRGMVCLAAPPNQRGVTAFTNLNNVYMAKRRIATFAASRTSGSYVPASATRAFAASLRLLRSVR